MESKVKQLQEAVETYGEVKVLHLKAYTVLIHLRDDLKAGKFTLEDMINHIYIMRQISKLADDIRKECDGIQHMFENVTCALYVTKNEDGPIRAPLATGTPDIKIGLKIPNQKKEPERFQQLMDFFGVPAEAINNKVVRTYWPGLCETVSAMAEEGKPLPDGINPDDTYPTYKVRIKSIQDLDELLVQIDNAKQQALKDAAGKEDADIDDLLTTRPKKK